MLRRRLVISTCTTLAAACRWLTVGNDVRDKLTQHLSALKEECKGQGLDLADMSDASKAAARAFQDCVQKSSVEDAQFTGKIVTLSASVKAYNTRLSNLQNEARSIQAEVDALVKLLWGTESPQGVNFASPPPPPFSSGATAEPQPTANGDGGGFEVEPPTISRILEDAPLAQKITVAKVEHVEAERVVEDKTKASSTVETNTEEAIEVETIEIEVEPQEVGAGDSGGAQAAKEDTVNTMKITDITKELYERGVNFADCLDARTLRQRYRDVLSGKVSSGYAGGQQQQQQQASKAYTEPLNPSGPGSSFSSGSSSSNQPRMPQKPPPQQQQYQAPPPNTSESGLANDPYPNAQRKMVDPMRYVWEIKQEVSAEKGIDASSVDLWSGKTKLDDGKRLYDYPSIQNYPIEVRQKGDVPR